MLHGLGGHTDQRGVEVRAFVELHDGQQLRHLVGELGQRGHAATV
jgi:hypothetical protein